MDNVSDSTESWNGTNWTEVNQMSRPLASMRQLAGSGIQTSALAYGHDAAQGTGQTESWGGTNWTETGDLNTKRGYLAGAGSTNASALAFGGNPDGDATEEFNSTATIVKTISTS